MTNPAVARHFLVSEYPGVGRHWNIGKKEHQLQEHCSCLARLRHTDSSASTRCNDSFVSQTIESDMKLRRARGGNPSAFKKVPPLLET